MSLREEITIFVRKQRVGYALSVSFCAGSVALVSMFVIVFSVLVRGPTVDETLRGSSENVFSFIKPRVFEAIGVISFAVRFSRLHGGFNL